MSIQQITNILVTLTLIEMMAAIGLEVTLSDLFAVVRSVRLIVCAALANYVVVPAVTVALLLAFQPQPLVAAGFLILAVCPGAPFGPPLTAIARGNVTVSVGLMALLAASSALMAPLLLRVLLPLLMDNERLEVDAVRMVVTLFVTQLIPLGGGLVVRHRRPALAERLRGPARMASRFLNLAVIALILATQYPALAEVRLRGYVGMLLLLTASVLSGWLLGGPDSESRRAVALTTSLRNLGLGLVIVNGVFAGTPAVTAVVAYGLFEVLGCGLLALAWGSGKPKHGGHNAPVQEISTH